MFTPGPRVHCHEHMPESAIAATIAKEMKKIAKENPFKPAGSIVNELIVTHLKDQPCPSPPSQDRLTHTANYNRQISRPKNLTDLEFDLNMDHVPDDFLLADIKRSDKRHLLFASSQQLSTLAKTKVWYIDSTFELVKAPFTQLFSINSFVRTDEHAKQVPLAFCLMSGKSKKDYKAVLKAVIDALPETPTVQRIVLDFEAAMWKAVDSILPEVEIQGCVFHWTQAVWRKVQDLGLKPTYMLRDKTYKYIRKLMALPFLPHHHIPAVFNVLAEEATDGPLRSLVEYIRTAWLESTVWHPSQWSVYFHTVRTNNDLEGWHHALNKKGRPQMELYLLLLLLRDEAKLVTVQVRLVSEKKLKRIQRKKYRDIQAKIFEYWGEFEAGERSARSLLKSCSILMVLKSRN